MKRIFLKDLSFYCRDQLYFTTSFCFFFLFLKEKCLSFLRPYYSYFFIPWLRNRSFSLGNLFLPSSSVVSLIKCFCLSSSKWKTRFRRTSLHPTTRKDAMVPVRGLPPRMVQLDSGPIKIRINLPRNEYPSAANLRSIVNAYFANALFYCTNGAAS